MPINSKHWPPKVGDPVEVQSRLDEGKQARAKIVRVDWRAKAVVIEYRARKVVSVLQVYEWSGMTCRTHHYEVDGIMHDSLTRRQNPFLFDPGGDHDSIEFDQLRWDSAEGGEGCWLA